MKKLFTILMLMFVMLAGTSQPIDNTNGLSPAFVRMPVKGTSVTRTFNCNVSLENNADTYVLTVSKLGEMSKINMRLWNKIERPDGTFLYLFDNATMVVEPVYMDSVMTETYVRDQFGDCIDTIYTKQPQYQFSMFKLTLYTGPESIYEKITFLFDNI